MDQEFSTRWRGPTIAAAIVSAVIGVLSGSTTLAQSTQTASSDWNTFSADITIRRSHVNGPTATPAGPSTTYHWEQTLVGQRWATAMTFVASKKPLVGPPGSAKELDGTVPSFRIEDAGDGSPIRVLDRHGKPVQMPDAAAQRQLDELARAGGGSSASPLANVAPGLRARPAPPRSATLGDIVNEPQAVEKRRAALVARFGAAKGKVRTLDRFATTRDDRTLEMLVDSQTALPIEMNVVENGALTSHVSIEYAQTSPGAFVRRAVRTEDVIPNAGGARMVTEVTFDNMQFERRPR